MARRIFDKKFKRHALPMVETGKAATSVAMEEIASFDAEHSIT